MMTARIKTLARQIRAKAGSTRGDTFVEVLVAIVVSGLAILMLAMSISVSANVNSKSRTVIDEYYKNINRIIESTASPSETPTKLTVYLESLDTATTRVRTSEYDVSYTTSNSDDAAANQDNAPTIVSFNPELGES